MTRCNCWPIRSKQQIWSRPRILITIKQVGFVIKPIDSICSPMVHKDFGNVNLIGVCSWITKRPEVVPTRRRFLSFDIG